MSDAYIALRNHITSMMDAGYHPVDLIEAQASSIVALFYATFQKAPVSVQDEGLSAITEDMKERLAALQSAGQKNG